GNIILTWTNKATNEYNEHVRMQIFKKKKLDKFLVGDVLMLNDFYSFPNVTDSRFYTSDQVKIVDIKIELREFGRFNERGLDKIIKLTGAGIIIDKYRNLIKTLNKQTKRIYYVYTLLINKLLSG